MKLERLSPNKIKYSITFEELQKRGFLAEELESFIWYDLFDEMVEVAREEYQLEASDTISVEIYSLNSKEIVLILTMDEVYDDYEEKWESHSEATEVLGKDFLYSFDTIDDLIELAFCMDNLNVHLNSKLYQFEEKYYAVIQSESEYIHSIFEEFGTPAHTFIHMVEEYGSCLIEEKAMDTLLVYFKK
jgi:adapter protein MecA 1/2